MKEEQKYLKYILETMARLDSLYIQYPDLKLVYKEDWVVQYAVLRALQTLAETTQRLSEELKKGAPHIHWPAIAMFRHALVHGYLGSIDHQMVWDVLDEHLHILKSFIKPYYEQHYGPFEFEPNP